MLCARRYGVFRRRPDAGKKACVFDFQATSCPTHETVPNTSWNTLNSQPPHPVDFCSESDLCLADLRQIVQHQSKQIPGSTLTSPTILGWTSERRGEPTAFLPLCKVLTEVLSSGFSPSHQVCERFDDKRCEESSFVKLDNLKNNTDQK